MLPGRGYSSQIAGRPRRTLLRRAPGRSSQHLQELPQLHAQLSPQRQLSPQQQPRAWGFALPAVVQPQPDARRSLQLDWFWFWSLFWFSMVFLAVLGVVPAFMHADERGRRALQLI
jgi:hypothetical protein